MNRIITMLYIDRRTAKSDLHGLINKIESGGISHDANIAPQIYNAAKSMSVADPMEFTSYLIKILARGSYSRARDLVDASDDLVLRDGPLLAIKAGRFILKWGLIFAAIALIVWWIAG